MLEIGQEWLLYVTPFRMKEVAAGPTGGEIIPDAIALYAKDKSGTSALYFKNDAGTEQEIPIGITTGSGVNTRVAFWSGTSTLSSDADLTFVTDTLTATKIVIPTAATFSFLTQGRVPFAGAAGLLSDSTNLFWGNTNACLCLGDANQDTASIRLAMSSGAGVDPRLMLVNQFSGDANGPQVNVHKSRGALPSTHGAVQASDPLGGLFFRGDDGVTFYLTAARIRSLAGSLWSATNRECYLEFSTTPSASTTIAERFRIGAAGQWGIGGATFGTALDVFTSGGAAAAPTWTAPGALTKVDDTNVTLTLGGTPTTALLRAASLTLGWTGQLSVARGGTGLSSISGDWLSQYFLLAGRSGGQNAIAGTAAGDDLGLYATANASPTVGINGSGAVVNIGVNSGATHPIATAFLETADAAIFRMKSPGTSKQVNLEWADANTRKWALYKLITDELALYDSVNSQTIFTYSPASAGVQFLIRCHPTWAPTTANSVAFLIDPVFTGSANGAQGFNSTPEFNPSANMAASYANLSINTSNPPSTITITQAIGAYYRNDYKSSVGAITTGINCITAGVNITGSVKPTNQFGMYCGNQGAAGIGLAANLYIDPCSGATSSFDIGFGGSDGTAVGAYFGRIPILYAGLLKYLAVYS